MTLADFPDFERLSAKERMKIAEELKDLAAKDALPVPESHKKLLRSRLAAYERGEVQTLTMARLSRAIRRRR